MKKVLASLLAILMMLSCLVVTASAEVPDSLSDDILALWDFEDGTNVDSIKGATLWRMNGTDNADDPNAVNIEDGVANVSATSEALYLQYGQRKKTGYSDHENKTILTKFYFDGTASSDSASIIFHRNADINVYIPKGSSSSRYTFKGKFFGTTVDILADNTPELPANQWYYLAITIGTYNTTTHTVEVNLYLSDDSDEYIRSTWQIEIAEEDVDKMLHPTTATGQSDVHSYFIFGKNSNKFGSKTTGINVCYDEIALFNRALSVEEIALYTHSDPTVMPDRPGDLSDKLLGYWDFEGEKKADIFGNKVSGTSAPLTEYIPKDDGSGTVANSDANPVLPVENGVVKVSGENYFSLMLTNAYWKKVVTDSACEKTIFAKFYVKNGSNPNGAVSTSQAIFGCRNRELGLEVAAGTKEDNFNFNITHLQKGESAIVREPIPAENIPQQIEGGWYYAAMVIGAYDTENEILPVDILLSNNGKDYTVTHFDINLELDTLNSASKNWYYNFGKAVHTSKSAGGLDFYFDEIAIYGCALTCNELALSTSEFAVPSADLGIIGYQTGAVSEGKFNTRFVGTINNLDSYKEVGFTVLISNAAGKTVSIAKSSTVVYSSLRATDEGGTTYEATTAEAENADALIAIRINDIPATGTYTVTILATAVNNSDETVNTSAFTYTLVDGTFTLN